MSASVQEVHDFLMERIPEGVEHSCPLDEAGARESAKEGRMPEAKTYTEPEHFAILQDTVKRETAEQTEKIQSLESEKATLQQRVDVLEAEVANEKTARAAAEKALEDFKAEVTQRDEIAARRGQRVDAVKAVFASAPDDYFTDERAQRWAEMADEDFNHLIEDLRSVAALGPHAFVSGENGCATCGKAEDGHRQNASVATETAAFKGGSSVTAPSGESLASQYLTARFAGPSA